MTILVFGNPDLPNDSLPVQLVPPLRQRFAQIDWCLLDPNEEWKIPDSVIVLDTVIGIKKVQVFKDLSVFSHSPRYSLHDFDALTNLLLLQKIGKLKKITVIGIPPNTPAPQALEEISLILSSNSL